MIKSLFHLRSFLQLTPRQLRSLKDDCKYRFDNPPKKKYGEPQTHKGEIKRRSVMIPEYELKKCQQKIHQLLSEFPLPVSMHGGVKNTNHMFNAIVHMNQSFFLTIDLKDFFKRISHHQVYKMFINIGCSIGVAHTLTKLTTIYGGLPQGAPSSSVIANLIFRDTAIELEEYAQVHGLRFSSFVDDQTFSSEKNFQELTAQILFILRKNGFLPCNNKIHYRRGFCEITGVYVKGNTLSVRHKMKNRAKRVLRLKKYVNFIESYGMSEA
jgi:RNA-directed DNA polymerase